MHPPTPSNTSKVVRDYSIKVYEIYIRYRGNIDGVKEIILVAILPTVVEYQRKE